MHCMSNKRKGVEQKNIACQVDVGARYAKHKPTWGANRPYTSLETKWGTTRLDVRRSTLNMIVSVIW